MNKKFVIQITADGNITPVAVPKTLPAGCGRLDFFKTLVGGRTLEKIPTGVKIGVRWLDVVACADWKLIHCADENSYAEKLSGIAPIYEDVVVCAEDSDGLGLNSLDGMNGNELLDAVREIYTAVFDLM